MDVAYAKIFVWYRLVAELADLKSKELKLRKKIAEEFFKDPKEGTNTLTITDGVKLKYTHKLNRSIDEATLQPVLKTMPEGSEDLLVKYKPELKGTAYKALSEEHRKMFDATVITKPSTPGLKLDIKENEDA